MRGGELAVECWDCQQMANMRGERNGECDYMRTRSVVRKELLYHGV